MPRPRRAAAALSLAVLVGCSSSGGKTGTAGASPSPTPSHTPIAFKAAVPVLPEVETIAHAHGVLVSSVESDWTLVAFGKVWINPVGANAINVYDARTGKVLGKVPVPQGPCAAMAADSTYVWTATCTERGVVRIDPRRLGAPAFHPFKVTTDGESSIGAAEGKVWAVADGSGCVACTVVGIDAATLATAASYPIPPNATAVRAGLGGVWISYHDDNTLVHLDPVSGHIVATVVVAAGPRFLAVGERSVWVLAQRAGALCRVSAENTVLGCTQLDQFGTEGGDLTVGDGYVWYRGTDALVVQVDELSGRVVGRIGDPEGSGSASAGSGQLWITAHDRLHVYRVPVRH